MPLPVAPLRNLSENIIGMPDVCEIQRYTWTEDSEGRPVQDWVTVQTTKCRRSSLGGNEIAVAGRLAPESNLRVVMPVGTDVTTTDRLKVGERFYEIEYVEESSPALQIHTVAFVSSQAPQG